MKAWLCLHPLALQVQTPTGSVDEVKLPEGCLVVLGVFKTKKEAKRFCNNADELIQVDISKEFSGK